MTHRQQIPFVNPDEEIRALEYSAHSIWAEAYGLKELIRRAPPEEIEAAREELTEAANMILALVGTKQ